MSYKIFPVMNKTFQLHLMIPQKCHYTAENQTEEPKHYGLRNPAYTNMQIGPVLNPTGLRPAKRCIEYICILNLVRLVYFYDNNLGFLIVCPNNI